MQPNMSEASDRTARNRFLLTNLAVLLIFILALLVLLSAYPLVLAPEPTETSTITPTRTVTPTFTDTPTITLSPTTTLTRRPTFTPTITPTPSRTPTPTLTPTPAGPPTLTPARPYPDNDVYNLTQWSPDKAESMAALMEDYPNTLPRQARGEDDANYYAAYQFAIHAYEEALLRYPDASQADLWRWRLAYDLARFGDPEAGKQYAVLIAEALNQDITQIEELPDWFQSKEPRVELSMVSITPLPGALSSYLVQLEAAGSAFLVINETYGAFRTETLLNQFDFVKRPIFSTFGSDLTGDGYDEVIILNVQPLNELDLMAPFVYDITTTPAVELPFNPVDASFYIGSDYEASWTAISASGQNNDLQFRTSIFPACPVTVTRTYRWNGNRFDLVQEQYQADPDPNTLAFCDQTIDHASLAWGPGPAIAIMEAILPYWPPETNIEGDPYPADGFDEWRYRLAVNHALLGNLNEATAYFNQIVTSPSIPTSRWIEPAQEFLAVYNQPADIYQACRIAHFCSMQDALSYLVEHQPAEAYPNLVTYLWESGVSLISSGYFDFDGDDSREIWFTLRHRPGEQLELWITAEYPENIKPFYMGYSDSNPPKFEYVGEDQIPPIFLVNGQKAFQMARLEGTLEPYLVDIELPSTYPNLFDDSLHDLRERLFAGEDPEKIQKELLLLKDYPGLLCAPFWSCDPYLYLLGLASELAGDEDLAVETYLQLWWDYSNSPYTTMARLKLIGVGIPPTLTPTLTTTVTLSPSSTPTVTGTPPTSTLTPLSTLAPTETSTPEPGTPYIPPATNTPFTPYP